jgi:hypothetical protein
MKYNYKCDSLKVIKYLILLTRSSNVAAQLERETQALLASLEEKVERRLEQLRMSLNTNALKKIRMSSADLKVIFLLPPHLLNISYLNASFKNI